MKNIKYTYKVLKILIITLISFSLFQISFAQENINENRLKSANERLETKKKEIINRIKNREINVNEGKKLLIQEREKIINSAKEDLRVENQKQENEKVKVLIESKLNPKLKVFDSSPIERQVLVYEKLIEKLKIESNKANLEEKQKIIIDMMIEIIENKKNNLSL